MPAPRDLTVPLAGSRLEITRMREVRRQSPAALPYLLIAADGAVAMDAIWLEVGRLHFVIGER